MIKPWDDTETFTLDEARRRYAEVEVAFAEIRTNYSGFINWFKRLDMRDDHAKTLAACVGVLMPLGHTEVVQTEVSRRARYPETLHYRIDSLSTSIMSYAGRFKNTDVYFAAMEVDEVP